MSRAIDLAQDKECTDVYLVGDDAQWLAGLRDAGFTVHQVQSKAELPADVFPFYEHTGHWGAVHIESGFVRKVCFAEDSVMAAIVLLSNFAPEFREHFRVQPVTVTPHDLF